MDKALHPRWIETSPFIRTMADIHPINISSLRRGKTYYVSHKGGPLHSVRIAADMTNANGAAGGVIIAAGHGHGWDSKFIRAEDDAYMFYEAGSHSRRRRSSSARRSSERRRRTTVRRTKSASKRH
jgi:hypothetical protein